MLANFFFTSALCSVYDYTLERAVEFGFDKEDSSLLLSVLGITNCVGVVLTGKLLDLLPTCWILRYMTLLVVVHGLVVVVSVSLDTFPGQVVCCSVSGLAMGGYLTSLLYTLATMFDNFNDSRDARSVFLVTYGLGSLVGPFVVGTVYDEFHSFEIPVSYTHLTLPTKA